MSRAAKANLPAESATKNLAVPHRGYVISTAVEALALPVRALVTSLSNELSQTARTSVRRLFQPRWGVAEPTTSIDAEAWRLAAMALVGQASGRASSLSDIVEWFCGDFAKPLKPMPSFSLPALDQKALTDLLPYVLEPHGPGSRLSVMKSPETQVSRTIKKDIGLFYTPADVADFMVTETLDKSGTVLDPACGSGVFLRAALKQFRLLYPKRDALEIAGHLYGTDINPWAVDAAAFVLLLDVLDDISIPPLAAWHCLRANLASLDSLQLDPVTASAPEVLLSKREAIRTQLRSGHSPRAHVVNRDKGGRLPLNLLWPELSPGVDYVIGNPPYANIGARADLSVLAQRFETVSVRPSPNADTYPPFVEQMVRLSHSESAGALVLPLSVACSTDKQFAALRSFMAHTSGSWDFAFFDREPHALFGEDVKTRNAIVHWTAGQKLTFRTGPLRRWRGDDRAAMLESVDFTAVECDVGRGIPKVHGELQARVVTALSSRMYRLQHTLTSYGSAKLIDLQEGKASEVFVAPTAYNFLGITRPAKLPIGRDERLSESGLVRLTCASEEEANAIYAVLSSHLAFWWWHVHGDGFHVNRGLLLDMPFGPDLLSSRPKGKLAELGQLLWAAASRRPLKSVNRGRVSISFPASDTNLRKKIDQVLCEALELPPEFATALFEFQQRIVNAELHVTPVGTGKQTALSPLTREAKEKSIVTKEEWREYTKTVWSIANTGHRDHPAVFPVEIPHRLTKLFSFYGETVLDPFSGTGTTAKAAIPLGRRAVCVDQNADYVAIVKRECAQLKNGHGPGFEALRAVHGDSRDLGFLSDNSVGLVVTSPPYWNKANYGEGSDNLGNIDSYAEFIEALRPTLSECYRVLMPGRKLCLVTANVNQHTDHGLLTFPLASDIAVLLRQVGFVMINEIIWSKDGTGGKWGSYGAQRPIFGSYPYPPNFLFKNVHEYILIVAKPATTKTKGKKVRGYESLVTGLNDARPLLDLAE